MRGIVILTTAIVCVVIADAPSAAQTQITTAVIQGVVRDSTGAVVPGATVEAVNLDTNLTQMRTSGADGRFVFLQLPPAATR